MKKVFVIAALLAAVFSTYAQEEGEDGKKKKLDLHFSVIGALDFSGISGESESYDGMLTGGQFGVHLSVLDLSDLISLRAGVEYSMQGGKYEMGYGTEPGSGYGNTKGSVRLNYLNFPVVTRYQSKGGFFAEAGLQPGVLLSAKDKIEDNSNDYKEYVNKFDMGVVVGGGYQVNKNIGIGARVTPGLLNINKKQSTYDVKKDRNLVFSLRGSYTF